MRFSSFKDPYSCLTDEALIQNVFPNKPDHCFESLYSRYVGKVYHQCLSMTKDSNKAQDFTQDIFLKVFHKLDAFQERSRFSTWLYSVSHNYCANQLRLGKRLLFTELDAVLLVEPADSQADFLYEETLRMVQKAIEMLSIRDRNLLQLKYEEGLSIAKIAQLYGVKISTVKMRLMRSRERVQQLIIQFSA